MNKGPVLGAPEGRDRQLSASEQCDAGADHPPMRAVEMELSWRGGESAQTRAIKMRLRFNPDGTLAGAPQIMQPAEHAVLPGRVRQRAVAPCRPASPTACRPPNTRPGKISS